MNIRHPRFNMYLLLIALIAGVPGCRSGKSEKKLQSSVRLHLETNLDGTERSQTINIGRSDPFPLSIETRSFLTEFNLERAAVVDAPGGFSISLQFDKEGSWILEQYSTANKGKRAAITAEFGELRWLAAPILHDRITSGHFAFTPDATRKESERIVRGLNNVAEKKRKQSL
jgi:preprotein translocase subunit SecD